MVYSTGDMEIKMLNEYIWQLYLKSGGKDVVDMFEQNFTKELTDGYCKNIGMFLKNICCSEQDIVDKLNLLKNAIAECNSTTIFESGEYTIESAMKYVYEFIRDDDDISSKEVFEHFSNRMIDYTTALAKDMPELFVPYYYQYNFNMLEKIAEEFDIELPSIPLKKDYEGRFYYYGKICEVLQDFRDVYNLSPFELYAFLYDFAPKYIGGVDSYIIKDLPEPKSAFLIGSPAQTNYIQYEHNDITFWQCNPETRVGDMVLMYERTPVSAITTIWRSVSIGFNDPFFYYYRCTYISHPKKVKKISLNQLKEDNVFKNIGIIRKNMIGVNGVELKPSEYNYLMDLVEADVPRIEFSLDTANTEFQTEKDVENILIKPLLQKLGYTEDDYVQQLYIEIGNHNHALIPDFVLLPDRRRGHQSAFALIEAKLSIPNSKEMDEVKIQARSYARQLNAKYSCIADMHRFQIFDVNDDYAEVIFSATWNSLKEPDTFLMLQKLIGLEE